MSAAREQSDLLRYNIAMAERLADAWAEILPESHREALFASMCMLIDDFFGESEHNESLLASYLPPRYTHRYDELFYRRFFATFMTIGFKLVQPTPPAPLLSCTAEELACQALISQAEAVLQTQSVTPDFDVFTDSVYQDRDHEYLFGGQLDGIEDTDVGASMGIGMLRFNEWFEPFLNATTPVHPYSA